jgi:hypothetical protein
MFLPTLVQEYRQTKNGARKTSDEGMDSVFKQRMFAGVIVLCLLLCAISFVGCKFVELTIQVEKERAAYAHWQGYAKSLKADKVLLQDEVEGWKQRYYSVETSAILEDELESGDATR